MSYGVGSRGVCGMEWGSRGVCGMEWGSRGVCGMEWGSRGVCVVWSGDLVVCVVWSGDLLHCVCLPVFHAVCLNTITLPSGTSLLRRRPTSTSTNWRVF